MGPGFAFLLHPDEGGGGGIEIELDDAAVLGKSHDLINPLAIFNFELDADDQAREITRNDIQNIGKRADPS